MVSDVGPFASRIFGSHMPSLRGENAGVSPCPGGAYRILAWAIARVYFLYVFCKFSCSLGVGFY